MKLFKVQLFLSWILSLSAYSQHEEFLSGNYLGLGIGYGFDRLKDTNLSPLNQKGNNLYYSIFYERYAKNILKLDINFTPGNFKSGPENKFETLFYRGNVSFTYLKNLSKNSKSTNFYLGGTYKLNVLYLDWFDQAAFSYFSNHGLSISSAISKQINSKHFIETSIDIPVLQFIARPPYNGIDEFIIENQDDPLKIMFNSDIASLKEFIALSWNLNYNYKLSENLSLRLDYDFNVQRLKTVSELTSVSNKFLTSVLYNF